MNRIKKNIIIFCCTIIFQTYAPSLGNTRQHLVLAHIQIPIEENNASLSEQELKNFCDALQTNRIRNYFQHLEKETIRKLAISEITIYDKKRDHRDADAKFISALLYALTYGDKKGFYAAEILLDHGASPLEYYNRKNALETAKKNGAPQHLIEKLEAKELELLQQL